MPELIEITDGKLRLNLHPGQTRAWESQARFVFIIAGTQSGKCVAPDTLVALADGRRKRIADIVPGDTVLTLTEDRRIAPDTVTASFATGIQPLYEVVTAMGRRIKVTADHPFYGLTGWRPCRLFAVGDLLAVPRWQPNAAVAWDTIRSITPLGAQPTWDITVAHSHNFIAQDIFAHNTSFGKLLLHKWIQELGPGDYLAVTATYDLFKLKMLPEMLRYYVDTLHWGTYVPSERVLVSHDGSTRIILRSASSPGGLESATVKAAWLDECGQDGFTLEAWEAIQRRLSLTGGRALGTTTPYNLGWLKTEIYDRWQAGDPDYDVIQFRSLDNPAFPRAEYERMKLVLPPWKFSMFYDGQFARPAGLVYGDFRPEVHVINVPSIPAHWPIYVGLDFGALHTAQVWLALNPTNRQVYIFRENLLGQRATAEHAALALLLAQGYSYVRWYGGAPGEQQARWDWTRAGVPVRPPPVRDVEAQIERVAALLRQGRLFVDRSLKGLIDEFATYSRELNADGQPTAKIAHKERYHRLDALRYAVAGLSDGGGVRVRSREY